MRKALVLLACVIGQAIVAGLTGVTAAVRHLPAENVIACIVTYLFIGHLMGRIWKGPHAD